MARVVALAALVASATAKDVIHWTLNPSYVFDVSGFVAPHPPKPLMIWNRPGNDFNGNEFFEHDNAGTIKWNDWCLEAASGDNGAVIQVNTCNSNNANQKWNLKGTNYGSLIQLQNTNKCVNVQNNEEKSGAPLQIWDCVDDQKMSFSFGGSPSPSPTPAPPTPPSPSSKCPNICSSSGFVEGDCRCDDHGAWAMWVCSKKNGQQQSKPWFCSQPGCHCNQMKETLATKFLQSAAYNPVIDFVNAADTSVTLMEKCTEIVTAGARQDKIQIPVPKPGAKFWIKPAGFTYDCKLDCLDCFYISANVAPSGALVTGIGYGHNTPVKVHDGVGAMELDATREDTKKPDGITCSTSSCNFNHIIPGFNTKITIRSASSSESSTVTV